MTVTAYDLVLKQDNTAELEAPNSLPAKLNWLYEFEQIATQQGSSDEIKASQDAADLLLASF